MYNITFITVAIKTFTTIVEVEGFLKTLPYDMTVIVEITDNWLYRVCMIPDDADIKYTGMAGQFVIKPGMYVVWDFAQRGHQHLISYFIWKHTTGHLKLYVYENNRIMATGTTRAGQKSGAN